MARNSPAQLGWDEVPKSPRSLCLPSGHHRFPPRAQRACLRRGSVRAEAHRGQTYTRSSARGRGHTEGIASVRALAWDFIHVLALGLVAFGCVWVSSAVQAQKQHLDRSSHLPPVQFLGWCLGEVGFWEVNLILSVSLCVAWISLSGLLVAKPVEGSRWGQVGAGRTGPGGLGPQLPQRDCFSQNRTVGGWSVTDLRPALLCSVVAPCW